MLIRFESYRIIDDTFVVVEFEIPYSEHNLSQVEGMRNTRAVTVVNK
jgi:hypothetical protein